MTRIARSGTFLIISVYSMCSMDCPQNTRNTRKNLRGPQRFGGFVVHWNSGTSEEFFAPLHLCVMPFFGTAFVAPSIKLPNVFSERLNIRIFCSLSSLRRPRKSVLPQGADSGILPPP